MASVLGPTTCIGPTVVANEKFQLFCGNDTDEEEEE